MKVRSREKIINLKVFILGSMKANPNTQWYNPVFFFCLLQGNILQRCSTGTRATAARQRGHWRCSCCFCTPVRSRGDWSITRPSNKDARTNVAFPSYNRTRRGGEEGRVCRKRLEQDRRKKKKKKKKKKRKRRKQPFLQTLYISPSILLLFTATRDQADHSNEPKIKVKPVELTALAA